MKQKDCIEMTNLQRRQFLTRTALATACAPLVALLPAGAAQAKVHLAAESCTPAVNLPFFGTYQGGIATPMQRHSYFVAFDLLTEKRADVIALLQSWTEAAAQMTRAPEQFDPHADRDQAQQESGVAVDLPASRLTVTIGFGPTLFEKNGKDRFGLAKQRPAALAELPHFVGDQLDPQRTGGDLGVQVCADDIQVVEYAIRRMAELVAKVGEMRWAQSGFAGGFKVKDTPRNLQGFKDGTMNIDPQNTQDMKKFVWVGDEGPDWLHDGSYMVIRPIRIALEHWDQMKTSFQESTFGRQKATGAPLGGHQEHDALNFDAQDKNGAPLLPENAHAAMAAAANNEGAQILRRSYSYDNGIARIAERWPPWHQAMMFDAGLLFQCYQRDPRTGFIKLFDRMSKFDMLNQFATHVGSGLFACPPGAKPGEFIGQRLFV
jgi:deferrochelatase/peroxidase EfeB